MSGVDKGEVAAVDVQQAHEGGDEQPLAVVFAELVIRAVKDLRERLAGERLIFDDRLGDDHEQRRRNALAGNVRHHDGKMRVVHHEEVVEVTADLLGGVHRGIDVELVALRKGGEYAGEHIVLDLRGHVQLRADALLFRRHGGQVVDVGLQARRHLIKGVGERFDLVAGLDLDSLVEVAAADARDFLGKVRDRACDASGQRASERRCAGHRCGHDGGEDQQGRDDDAADLAAGLIGERGDPRLSLLCGAQDLVHVYDRDHAPRDAFHRLIGEIEGLAVHLDH